MNISIMVVDDETPICEWLVYCIKKASEDYRVHAASNGEEALKLILREKPDIVFTDIRMPGMDGLELMQKTLEKLPYTVFAILTNHAEFFYAKQAVSLGAKEYFLKSELRAADIESLIAGVVKNKTKIATQKAAGDLFPSGCNDLYSFYKNRDKPGFADSFWEKQGMAEKNPYVVLAVKDTFDPEHWQQLVEIPQRVLPKDQNGLYTAVSSIRGAHYIVLQATQTQQLQLLVEPLARMVLETTGLAVGVSAQNRARSEFEATAMQSKCALDALFFGGADISRYERLVTRVPLNREELRSGKRAILELLAQHRFGDAAVMLERWFDEFACVAAADVNWGIDYCRRMVLAIEERYFQQTDAHTQQMEVQQTLFDCKNHCSKLVVQMENQYAGQCSPAVETALEYIHQHYNSPISMAEVARQVYRSPEYFSRQFKDEVGENFSVYLTLYRLNRAQEFLRNTDYRVSEIAEMVGYTTPGYFSRLYKKYKGVAPDMERGSK